MALRGKQFKDLVTHTINNNEIGGTYCGKSVPYHSVSDPTPWDMGDGHIAQWDSDDYAPGHRHCSDCGDAYEKNAQRIERESAERWR
jgi:hypothetical protein